MPQGENMLKIFLASQVVFSICFLYNRPVKYLRKRCFQMIFKAMIVGFVIGAILGVISSGLPGALTLGILGAVLAIPIRKWMRRTFWQ